MAQFQSRPEDPSEWGGLPAEPRAPASPAEELAVSEAVDAAAFGLGGMPGLDSVIVTLPTSFDEAQDGGR